MILEDKGIVLQARPFQESGLIVKCFLQNNGIIRGLYRKNKKAYPVGLGNVVEATWQAKISNQLGYYSFEPIYHIFELSSSSYAKMLMLSSVISLINDVVPEHEPQLKLFEALEELLLKILHEPEVKGSKRLFADYALFELQLLKESGFEIDLSRCVVSQTSEDLQFISPKSGCAVSREHGMPYVNKLFSLPQFFICQEASVCSSDILAAFKVTGYFIQKHILTMSQQKHSVYREKFLNMVALFD